MPSQMPRHLRYRARTSSTIDGRGARALGATIVLGLVLGTGCANKPPSATRPADQVGQTSGVEAIMSAEDRHRLETIARTRAERSDGGYRIGPDDLLDIRIPDLLDPAAASAPSPPTDHDPGLVAVVRQAPVFQQGARVSAAGDITLPLIGTVRAGGMTPAELEAELARRLVSGGVLRRPQVSVLVAEYRSRVVAVIGSVERPGLYPLTRPAATLADLIWAAGGPTKDAGRVVAFVPMDSGGSAAGAAPDLTRLERGERINIDLEALLHGKGADSVVLNPQARAGDLISVSPAGNVNVEGWVQKPGSYPVTRSLTLSGAVAAAGGRLFPADGSRVSVKRSLATGGQATAIIDLDRIASGADPDPPITDGDVVNLPASIPRMIPYGAWQLVTAMIHVGASIPLF
jgi:polysaccharide biosynthesis/export protein